MTADTTAQMTSEAWEELNNDYLSAGMEWLNSRLRDPNSTEPGWWENERWSSAGLPPALEILGEALGMSRFERLTLFLAAAPEWGWDLDGLRPTLALALRTLPEPAWDAVSSRRPLRYWRLVQIHHSPPTALVDAPISADERIANYLKGLNIFDARLEHLVRPCQSPPTLLTASQGDAVEEIVATFREAQDESVPGPVIELVGPDQELLRAVAVVAGQVLGRDIYELVGERISASGPDPAELIRLWERETILMPLGLYADVSELERINHDALASWLADLRGVALVGCREAWPVPRRHLRLIDVRRPTADEQEHLWTDALDPAPEPHDDLAPLLSGRFNLSQFAIARAITYVNTRGGGADDLWNACKINAQPRLETLATRIEPVAHWQDLVLPDREMRALGYLVAQVRGRSTVLRHWGFGERITRGNGVTAMFAGQSGTGKSLAAEIIANELDLTLYRVDLSGVVSKYIGETERNLRRVFDAADEGGVLLLFDEADALFGKRSDVKDSHDRYANIEVNYLLQRMEDYAGVAILTTNQRHAIDQAFMRRLRFVVNFPFPSQAERKAMWQRVFPDRAPVEDLDIDRLASLAASGGMIRNIALNAAYTAAGSDSAVTTELVLSLAHLEFVKHELPVNEHDFKIAKRQPA
jgi:ATPase family associated with various cellular activities (AAA)